VHKGKKYQNNFKLIQNNSEYDLNDACSLIKDFVSYKFDESIDVSIIIKKDTKNPIVKGSVVLPHGNGKKSRILLLTRDGDQNTSLKDKLNIDCVGGNSTIEAIEKKSFPLNYDYIVTTPDMLVNLKKIARVLGPKGLMPSVNNGTVTTSIENTIDILQKGKIYFKSNKNGVINTSIGRMSFEPKNIHDNFIAIFGSILKIKPSTTKGYYIKSAFLSTTMGPSIKINFANLK